MRRYIVGPRGATLREVCQEFAGVRVSVPPPSDTRTATIRLCGPARQVPAALARLEALLRQAEVIEAQVAVTPRQRCHVVGPAGATVRRLLQEFPDVQVRVPPATDKVSRTVLLRGPRTQVAGAEAFVRGVSEGRWPHRPRRSRWPPSRPPRPPPRPQSRPSLRRHLIN
ncbi:vigilin-like [Scylla paramamosain]|uniref:vigilin-like n=1 Tax=Scylla paramamosain TaxID=85552 RepID=UPI003083EB8C